MKKPLPELEQKLQLTFKDASLLELAFVHKSYLNEAENHEQSNERLEFLGDAVLELSVTDYLYRKFPHQPEGQLTNLRSALVKRENLATVARILDLGSYLYLSRGEELSGGRDKDYILANTMEAFIGALYLDQGYTITDDFIQQTVTPHLDAILASGSHIDAKTRIQEFAQEKFGVTPYYELLHESGPDHSKVFVMGVYFEGDLKGKGEGGSKQEAEQSAAADALKALGA